MGPGKGRRRTATSGCLCCARRQTNLICGPLCLSIPSRSRPVGWIRWASSGPSVRWHHDFRTPHGLPPRSPKGSPGVTAKRGRRCRPRTPLLGGPTQFSCWQRAGGPTAAPSVSTTDHREVSGLSRQPARAPRASDRSCGPTESWGHTPAAAPMWARRSSSNATSTHFWASTLGRSLSEARTRTPVVPSTTAYRSPGRRPPGRGCREPPLPWPTCPAFVVRGADEVPGFREQAALLLLVDTADHVGPGIRRSLPTQRRQTRTVARETRVPSIF